jgi:hypothetical protein
MRGRRPNYAWVDLSDRERIERIMRKVRKRSDGCWEWVGKRFKNGYGQMCISVKLRKKRYFLVHRLMWALRTGASPGRLHILHKCDRPWCVRLSHLFIGTAKDNVRDMVSKNRQRWMYGERSPKAKLTRQDVVAIRQLASKGELHRVLAARFHVSKKQITTVVNRRQWKHLP